VALPRYSFVQTALVGGKSVASFLRITLAAWWHSATTPARAACASTSTGVAMVEDCTCRRPQPLTAFPELQRLRVHDAWLANPAVGVQCMWDTIGWHGLRFRYFILSDDHLRTLAILLQEQELVYMRMHANYAFAAVDGTLWAGEIRDQPVRRVFANGGIDHKGRGIWSIAVVQRARRCELQITSGGLIPWTCDFRTFDDAMLSAEEWLTDFHHANATATEEPEEEPVETEWLM